MGLYFKTVPEVEWEARTSADREISEAFLDPVWRIANMYTIYNKELRQFVPFRPKPEQRVIIWAIFVLGIKNIIIPKARQIGFSTLLAIISMDITMFNSGAKCALVDKTKLDGLKKFNDIIRLAWDRLPAGLRAGYEEPVLNSGEFGVRQKHANQDDGWSRFRVEHSGRGDALVFLWVSEWGTIQFKEPLRSNEILTGGMEAAEGNIRVIETTWKGGEGGDVWPFVQLALSMNDGDKTLDDWFLFFFPWWVEPRYTKKGSIKIIPEKTMQYLNRIERQISAESGREFRFTDGQRLWYHTKQSTLGLFVLREYPSVLEECWQAPVEGAIYAAEYATALAEGRVTKDAYDPSHPVYTSWDLGGPENMVVWYFQIHHGKLWWIDVDMKLWLTTPERVSHMKAKDYKFAAHFIPHDADHVQKGAITYENELLAAGLEKVIVIKVTRDPWLGINRVLQWFPRFHFDSERCASGIKSIKNYHVHEKTGEIVHDWSSHACDGMRTMAEAAMAGHLDTDSMSMTHYNHLLYFDAESIEHLQSRAVAWEARLTCGVIEHDTWVKRELDDPHAWLRQWEPPYQGQRYLLTVAPPEARAEGWAAAVWRSHIGRAGDEPAPVLVCALASGLAADKDRVSLWVAAMSRLYGHCLIMPLINDVEGLVDMLAADRSGPVWAREEARENQTIGKGRRNRKPGFKLSPAAREQALAVLRARVREQSIEVAAGEVAAQARTFVTRPDGPPAPLPGQGQAWLLTAAMACHGLRAATLYATRAGEPAIPAGRGHVPPLLTGGGRTRRANDLEG